MFKVEKDEVYYYEEPLKYCPDRGDGKICHYHKHAARNFVHNCHCLFSECEFSSWFQWAIRNDDPRTLDSKHKT